MTDQVPLTGGNGFAGSDNPDAQTEEGLGEGLVHFTLPVPSVGKEG